MLATKCQGVINFVAVLITSVLVLDRHGNFNLLAECTDTETEAPISVKAEPPFPLLFNPGNNEGPIRPRTAKIVSEVKFENTKTAVEEYLDLDSGKAAFQTASINSDDPNSSNSQRQVIFTDSSLNQIFIYKPYSCVAAPMDKKSLPGIDIFSVTIEGIGGGDSKRNLRIYGVASMWLHMGYESRKYELLGTIYSNHRDALRVRHQWTYVDKQYDIEFRLIFTETIMIGDESTKSCRSMAGDRMRLEAAQVKSLKTGAMLRTFNVISVEYELTAEVYDTLLQVPVGYGCEVDQNKLAAQGQAERFRRGSKLFAKNLWSSSKVDLEVSGTKIDLSHNNRSSDTVYVELVHVYDKIIGRGRGLAMIKIRSDTAEIKTILNYVLMVRYKIDMQDSTCQVSHLTREVNRPADEPYTYVRDPNSDLLVTFSNGLEFSFEPEQLEFLFYNGANYTVVKETKVWLSPTEKVTYTYVERTIDSWPYGTKDNNKFARQVRTFVTREPSEDSKKGWRPGHTRLESFTIWVFEGRPGLSSTIEAVYQINVVNHETGLSRWPDVPRLFDVSHECYLQNEDMHSGQDYAWIEYFYPLSSRELDILERHETRLDRELHNQLTRNNILLTSFQVPRMELIFSDEGLLVRALLLDVPSLHLIYEQFTDHAIRLNTDQGGMKFITPDVGHCSKLCKQYSCESMTFCSGSCACLLSMRPVFASGNKVADGDTSRLQTMFPNPGCVTYSANGARDAPKLPASLSSVLSMMKHYEYDYDGMPRLPDDWKDIEDPNAVIADYHTKFSEYFAKRGQLMMTIFGNYNNQPVTLVPSSFLIEDDPFEKLRGSIIGGAQNKDADEILHDSGRIADYFHEGLSMSRYKYNAFHNGLKEKGYLLFGITYDQCALGCLNNKCGTFSYCPSRKECTLTTFNRIADASRERLVESDADCFISQRDFTKNFQKYHNVKRPLRVLAGSVADSASDCALACMQYDAFHACLSFQYCPRIVGFNNCEFQSERHPEHIFNDFSPNGKQDDIEASDLCDHYERSYLAEFNQIESTQFQDDLWTSFNTTTIFTGKTTFECADICLNKLSDCSAFQFCLQYSGTNDNHMQQCRTISGKLPLANGASGQDKLELVIDPSEHDSESLIKANKFLKYSDNCQVFALRPNTVEGHLRDLALGNTMTVSQKEELEHQTKEPASFSGYQMSCVRYLLVFVGTITAASLITVGALWAYQRNEVVRYQVERLKSRVYLR